MFAVWGVVIAAAIGAPALYSGAALGWMMHADNHKLAVRKDEREQWETDEKKAKSEASKLELEEKARVRAYDAGR
ncbi:unnamed protein product [Clonostachys byssicola]|uniref:Uncharacterized protein n=1 Tax=Clonostachys byssicola TaxID=160290 RepID=A0A9N9Y025_9HYPO|nr:unnamed protein product [Clonostachys byssicola]